MMNVQCEEEILKEKECLMEVLNTAATSETNRSQYLETNILCVLASTKNKEIQFSNVFMKDEGRGHNLNSVEE